MKLRKKILLIISAVVMMLYLVSCIPPDAPNTSGQAIFGVGAPGNITTTMKLSEPMKVESVTTKFCGKRPNNKKKTGFNYVGRVRLFLKDKEVGTQSAGWSFGSKSTIVCYDPVFTFKGIIADRIEADIASRGSNINVAQYGITKYDANPTAPAPSINPCTDSDGGPNAQVFGTCKDVKGTFSDSCTNPVKNTNNQVIYDSSGRFFSTTVNDVNCAPAGGTMLCIGSKAIPCPAGQECKDGSCKVPSQTCTVGMKCKDNNRLAYQYFNCIWDSNIVTNCPYGCSNGACLPAPSTNRTTPALPTPAPQPAPAPTSGNVSR